MNVRVRYAPSPTGNPHVGNIRTALFTFLYARHNNGEFLIRIEDTDKKREVFDSHEAILQSLKWLGLNFDGEPVLQSTRLNLYKEHAQKLVEKGFAYKKEGAIYFKVEKNGETSWIDLVGNKQIIFKNDSQKDFVILKSDEYPTYHLASVVDDHLMGITLVSRGEDWISSTPKHIMLYKAFGWEKAQFAHFPNILAADRSKLSKRHGSIGVLDYKKDGFLPEALVNFLALLGWTSPSGKEILTLQEMIVEFDIKDINIAPSIFDLRKLEWMNGEYIRKSQISDLPDGRQGLKSQIKDYLKDISGGELDHPTDEELDKLMPLVKERMKKLSDFIPLTVFLFEKVEYDQSQFQKLKIKNQNEAFVKIIENLKTMQKPWQADVFEQTFRNLAEELDLSASQMFQLIRVAISGQTVTPPLFESIQILGEEETARRIEEAKSFVQQSS